jgi:hypothetical protein
MPKRSSFDGKVQEDRSLTKRVKTGGIHDGKPPPWSEPIAWALTRQALCDSLPYFKAHQSSAYLVDKKVLGIYLSDATHTRDYFGQDVIITTVYGFDPPV